MPAHIHKKSHKFSDSDLVAAAGVLAFVGVMVIAWRAFPTSAFETIMLIIMVSIVIAMIASLAGLFFWLAIKERRRKREEAIKKERRQMLALRRKVAMEKEQLPDPDVEPAPTTIPDELFGKGLEPSEENVATEQVSTKIVPNGGQERFLYHSSMPDKNTPEQSIAVLETIKRLEGHTVLSLSDGEIARFYKLLVTKIDSIQDPAVKAFFCKPENLRELAKMIPETAAMGKDVIDSILGKR